MRGAVEDALAFLLSYAAENAKNLTFAGFTLELLKTAEYFLFGFIADAASVVEDELGFVGLGNLRVAAFEQSADYLFGVVRVHLTAEGLDVEGLHGSSAAVTFASSMQHAHEPADAEESQHETAEAIGSIVNAFAIGALRNEPQNDAHQQRENDGKFEVIDTDLHRRLVLLACGDLVGIDHRENI